MSAAAVVMTVEGVLLAVAIVFVVALLRSHAEILRRLGALEDPGGLPAVAARAASAGTGARDLVGETLAGDAVKVALGEGSSSSQTLLAFMSSGCSACGPLWSAVRDGARVPAGARLVIVTKDRQLESVSRLEQLAPAGHELVMSSEAWRQYEVEATPHFVLVDGSSGAIAGRGSAASWEQLAALVEQASEDVALAARQSTTSDRAARAEEALARAGITPGHPSLYPSRTASGESGRR